MKKIILFFAAAFVFFTGCDKNPAGALIYSDVGKSVEWAPEWVLYDDESKTRYEAVIRVDTSYWAHDNPDALDLQCETAPHSGRKCIRLYWDGSRNFAYDGSYYTYAWTGFVFPSASPNTGIYIPNGTYNYLKFWVKGSLTYGVQLEIKGPRDEVWLSPVQAQYPQWTEITVPFAPSSQANIGPIYSLIAISLKNSRGDIRSNGGEIFIDDIRYVK
jgi:hypothetical protein